jgi:C4-type Zn-finger protein
MVTKKKAAKPKPCPVCEADRKRRSRYYDKLPKPPNLKHGFCPKCGYIEE